MFYCGRKAMVGERPKLDECAEAEALANSFELHEARSPKTDPISARRAK
jgi:hypothetical protein